MRKHIDVLRIDRRPEAADRRGRILEEAASALLGDPTIIGLELNIPWPSRSQRHSTRIWPELGAIDAVLSRWYDHDDDGTRTDLAALPGITPVWSFAVQEHIAIERVKDWPDGTPTSGVKHVSLLCGTCSTAEFRAAYRHHVELVHEHLPTMWRYVQNDVDEARGDRAAEFAAISELSYRNQDDYDRRWKHGERGEAEFRSHEGFLDLPKTVTIMCTEHILRTPPTHEHPGRDT